MKKLIFFLVVLTVAVLAQDTNKVIIEDSGEKMLIGKCSREAFTNPPFEEWWNTQYEMYDVDSSALSEIKNKIEDVDLTIVLGTWCSDSRREVPRMFKILDVLNFPEDKIKILAVDREKKTEAADISAMEVNFVPTFIFYKEGKEIGRIIETPVNSLEKDLAEILE